MIVACPKCGVKNRIDERAKSLQPVCGRCGTELEPSAASAEPLVVTDSSFEQAVLRSPVPVLLDCWAPWCGPCRMLSPTLEALAKESNGSYRVAKLNVDENPRVAGQFNISSIPNVLVFNGGKMVEQIVGLRPKDAYAGVVRKLVGA